MNFNIIIGETLKKIRLNKLAYKNQLMFKIVSKSINDVNINNSYDARKFLNETSLKPKGRSIIKNNLKESIYDLTIIVPAYNVEQYIDECLISILNQKTDYQFKVVVINDESTDSTGEILKKYKTHKNVEIITQKNKGLSGARNAALRQIDSKYIMFVDSDDKLTDNSIQALMKCAFNNDSDIVEGSYYKFNNNNDILERNIHTPQINIHAFNNIRSFAWGKVIKSSLFENICFPEGFWYEDTVFMYLVFPLCKKASTISDCVYLYRHNINGITVTSRKNKKCIDTFWIIESMLDDMKTLGIKKNQDIYEFTLYQIWFNFRRIRYMDVNIQKSIFLLSADLINNNFSSFKTRNKNRVELERALKEYDFIKYYLYCILF